MALLTFSECFEKGVVFKTEEEYFEMYAWPASRNCYEKSP
jgi:hypothetical protein